jgi:tRNA-specific 2-thiouridylase
MKKVVIGVSGGVDSSDAAYLLKKEGYEVIGVTLLLCDNGEADLQLAKDVCKQLGIEHITVDRRELFKSTIMSDFVKIYENGGTPNPCVICNMAVKFTEMLKVADKIGADFIATGHYSAVLEKDGRFLIKRPEGKSKDQTYMLYKLTQSHLSRTLMPLNSCTKARRAVLSPSRSNCCICSTGCSNASSRALRVLRKPMIHAAIRLMEASK